MVSKTESILSLVPSGTIALESAASFYDLCTFSNDYLIFLTDNNLTINKNQFIRFYPNKLGNSDIVKFNDRLTITTPDRTVCEMIAYDRRDDFIIEALECYIFDTRDDLTLESLYECAKKYNVYEQLLPLVEIAKEMDDYWLLTSNDTKRNCTYL